MRKKMILLALTLFIGLSACGNDDKELPDEPGKEQGGNGSSISIKKSSAKRFTFDTSPVI